MTCFSCLALAAMPPKRGGPTLFGPEGDFYYALFVALVIVGFIIGAIFFVRRSEPRGGGGQGEPPSA